VDPPSAKDRKVAFRRVKSKEETGKKKSSSFEDNDANQDPSTKETNNREGLQHPGKNASGQTTELEKRYVAFGLLGHVRSSQDITQAFGPSKGQAPARDQNDQENQELEYSEESKGEDKSPPADLGPEVRFGRNAMRSNFSKDITKVLMDWFQKNLHNPYPNEEERVRI